MFKPKNGDFKMCDDPILIGDEQNHGGKVWMMLMLMLTWET